MTHWKLDATDLLDVYAKGDATPTEVVSLMTARIAALNPFLNAYTNQNEAALEEAASASARWAAGAPKGPLDGLPMIIKDNLVTAGMPASWGNAALAKRIPLHDEAPIARLRDAGAIFLGKGNTPEFAVEGYTDNLTFGATRNPFEPNLTPGGSSGGVVAAVASGMAFAGIGTDGGGSIRRPAGYTGLYGLKPGIGHVHRSGGLHQVLLDFETVGPITRSARDLSLLDAVMSDQRTTTSLPSPKRILAVQTLDDAPCDPTIRRAFDLACQKMSYLGHQVTSDVFPLDLAPLNAVWSQIGEVGLAAMFADDMEIRDSANHKYVAMSEVGRTRSAADFYRILGTVFQLRHNASKLFDNYDLVLMPTSAANPWSVNEPYPERIDDTPVGPRGHAIYTGWVNAMGLPSVAYPAPSSMLPIGMQLIGPMGSEALLMALSAACSDTFIWPEIATIPS